LLREVNGIKVYQYQVPDASMYDSSESSVPEPAVETAVKPAELPVNEIHVAADPSVESSAGPVPSLPEGIAGLVYRIQLGVFSKPKEADAFGDLFPVYEERLPEKDVFKYYTGNFSSSESVTAALEKIRNNGFPDAFVVAFYDAKPISTEKAREIEFAGMRL